MSLATCYWSMRDVDRVRADAEHQPLALGLEVQDDVVLVLEPDVADAGVTDDGAVLPGAVGAGNSARFFRS